MPAPKSHGFFFEEDRYYSYADGKVSKVDRLLPQETPLEFHVEYLFGCIEAHEECGLGCYSNGWEL